MKFKLTKLEKSWILYDVGNSAFILLTATLLQIYFNNLAELAGKTDSEYLSYWAYAGSIATLLVAIIGPICGTLTDQRGFKKPLFLLSIVVGIVGCVMLGVTWSWLSFLVIFVIAKVGYSSANVFYDSMLPEIADHDRMDRVSTLGYALGYIGSVIPFVLCLVVYIFHKALGITEMASLIISFVITAVWWLVCSLPLIKQYKQKAYQESVDNPIRATFKQLACSFKEAKKHKHIFMYLIAFFFFIDGVYTIIDMATAYGKSLGLNTKGLLLALLVTQIVAFPCSIIFGRLSAKHDTGLLLKICIICYTGIALFAIFLMELWQFWTLAVMVGMFQGGIQALSRSYLGKIIPAEQSGEYYGLMDICGKGASFLGTMLVGTMAKITGDRIFSILGLPVKGQGLAVGSIAILFVIGFILFCYADKLNKARSAE